VNDDLAARVLEEPLVTFLYRMKVGETLRPAGVGD